MKIRFVIIILSMFAALSIIFYLLKWYAPDYNFAALMTGNTIMALLSLGTYFLIKRQLAGNPHAFVRGVYGASFFKLMVCMIAILIYVLLNRTHIHKQSVFILFGIYAAYTTVETLIVSKLVKEVK